MDAQLRRGLLDICVLAVLRRGDSYGYQLVKDMSELIEITESTLYPILRRLESGGLVTVYSVEHNSRLRKSKPQRSNMGADQRKHKEGST